jgi:hypothetical protein
MDNDVSNIIPQVDKAEAGKSMEKIGIIIRRRSMGKNLLFSYLKLITGDDGEIERTGDALEDTIIQAVFRRSSPVWESSHDNTFPTKKSALPYGAVIKVQLRCDNNETSLASSDNDCPKYEVIRWFMLTDPRAEALKDASKNIMKDESGGISQHLYFKSRMNQFLKYNESQGRKERKVKPLHEDMTKDNNSMAHGDKKHKAMRAKIFATFLVELFGPEMFQDNHDSTPLILDVAGGKGMLSLELSLRCQSQCTIIDPLIRGKNDKQQFTSRAMKLIKNVNGRMPTHLAQCFEMNEKCLKLVRQSTMLVGLHPDECTEDILDAALLTNKPAAIIPCCVFASLFPERKLKNGASVCSYDDFLSYLMEKDDRIKRFELPFEGKNQVLVFDPR